MYLCLVDSILNCGFEFLLKRFDGSKYRIVFCKGKSLLKCMN